ncbi:MAG: hypothetical protein K2P92_00045 [Bdellovibrionaceae bacterium]|nr:hypothetical protein [Pseudobdellovibrionaceae bacterium]
MKKLIVLALLVVSQITLAGPVAREGVVRRMTIEQARERVRQNPMIEQIERLRAQGKDMMSDPVLRERMARAVRSSTGSIRTLSGAEHTNVMKLINVNPVEVMSEVMRLSSVKMDPTSTAKQKAAAVKSLELMALAGNGVTTVQRNSAELRTQQTNVTKIIEVSRKISSLDFGTASDAFVAKYERALREGKTVEQAIRIASNNKFGIRELRECE